MKLIFDGCSFTDKNYYDFRIWPDIIGDKIGCEVVNNAKSGSGNQMIAHRVIKSVLEHYNNIKHVYIMWSDWDRDYIVNNTWQNTTTKQNDIIDLNMNTIYTTQLFLDKHKIKWTMASIFEPIMFDNKEFNELEYYKYFVEHPLYDYIDDNRFWGWPIGKHMGGNNIKSFLKDKMGDSYRRSKDDTHPNQKAHELIATVLNDYNMLQTG